MMKLFALVLVLLINYIFNDSKINRNNKPNIIVILADDLGWNDVSYHGSNQIPTPNIDALGYNGVILEQFYTQQTCTPSRAALLTGNYPIRSGLQGTPIITGENRSLPLEMPLMSEHLKNLGYSTHLVGKWHLGAAYRQNTPTLRGFDSHFGYWNGFCGYFNYMAMTTLANNEVAFRGFDLHDGFTPAYEYDGEYATDLFTKKAEEIIEKAENPLFLVLSHLAPHTGDNGTELGVPDENATNSKFSYIKDPKRRLYADVVSLLDDSVGKIVRKLETKNMLENSIIIFLSDNGGQTHGIYENAASNWPLRGLKFTLFQGGVRGTATIFSPLFEKRGYVNKQLIHITDLLPTFYSIAGGNVDNLGQIDGIDQWEVLSRNRSSKRHEILLNIDEVQKNSALIAESGRYKLVNGSHQNGIFDDYYGEGGRGPEVPPYDYENVLNCDTNLAIQKLPNNPLLLTTEKIRFLRSETHQFVNNCRKSSPRINCQKFCLFDLNEDPCETLDVKEENLGIFGKMRDRLGDFWRQLVPQKNQAPQESADPKYYNNTWCTWLDDSYCFKTRKM